jgi:hypothetical protein
MSQPWFRTLARFAYRAAVAVVAVYSAFAAQCLPLPGRPATGLVVAVMAALVVDRIAAAATRTDRCLAARYGKVSCAAVALLIVMPFVQALVLPAMTLTAVAVRVALASTPMTIKGLP